MSGTPRVMIKVGCAALAAVLVATALPSAPSYARGGPGGGARGGGGGPGALGGTGAGALGGTAGASGAKAGRMTDPSDYLDQLQREAAEANLPEFIRIARDGAAFESADDDRDAGLAAERDAASRRQRKRDLDGSHPQ